jgi:hypothetical protein
MADNFPAFPAGSRFVIEAAMGFPIIADSKNWHTAANLFELQWETSSRY